MGLFQSQATWKNWRVNATIGNENHLTDKKTANNVHTKLVTVVISPMTRSMSHSLHNCVKRREMSRGVSSHMWSSTRLRVASAIWRSRSDACDPQHLSSVTSNRYRNSFWTMLRIILAILGFAIREQIRQVNHCGFFWGQCEIPALVHYSLSCAFCCWAIRSLILS